METEAEAEEETAEDIKEDIEEDVEEDIVIKTATTDKVNKDATTAESRAIKNSNAERNEPTAAKPTMAIEMAQTDHTFAEM